MAAAGGSLFPSWTQLPTIVTVSDAVTWFGLDNLAWNLWLTQVGDTQDDLRLLAALPKNAVTGACGLAAQKWQLHCVACHPSGPDMAAG